jgi:hypothetical protein
MVFSDHPATCVTAGAGSGKSTTLTLRVVFMLLYLDINIQDITVVSFTRKSCEDLRNSLIKKLAHWNYILAESEAKDLVRTFHSALHRAAKCVGVSRRFFEYHGKNKSSQRSPEMEDDDDENPFSTSRLSNEQLDLLHDVYQRLYESSKKFRSNVLGMLRHQLRRDLVADKVPDSVSRASRRDRELVHFVNERWKRTTCWPIEGVEEGPVKISIQGFDFYANGRIKKTREPVFLGSAKYNGEWLFGRDELLPCADPELEFPIVSILTIKKQVLVAFLEGKRIYIT